MHVLRMQQKSKGNGKAKKLTNKRRESAERKLLRTQAAWIARLTDINLACKNQQAEVESLRAELRDTQDQLHKEGRERQHAETEARQLNAECNDLAERLTFSQSERKQADETASYWECRFYEEYRHHAEY